MKVISQTTWKKLFSLPYHSTQSQTQTIDLSLDYPIGDPLATATDWSKHWIGRFEKITPGVPDLPPIPSPSELSPGWNRYDGHWQPSVPPDGTIVFDTETHGKYKQYPIFGVAVNPRYWYLWVSSWVFEGSHKGELIELNPESLVIAHNASFDVGRVANSYRDDRPYWLDTQSLVQATNGLPRKLIHTFNNRARPSWFKFGCGVSLKDAVTHWVRDGSAEVTEADKQIRTFFADCDTSTKCHQGLHRHWHTLLRYSFNDVWATYRLFCCVLPEFLKVCPSPISLMAQSLMLQARFPINPDFEDWVEYCDREFKIRQDRIESIIQSVIADTKYEENCPWLSNLDWSSPSRGKNKGKPRWETKSDITMRSRKLPYLLKLSWEGKPIRHNSTLGWHYLDDGQPVRLPHKLGEDNNVGNPLADIYCPYIDNGVLRSELPGFDLKEFHRLYFETTYWLGNSDRIGDVVVVGDRHIPSIVPHRTVTRRSGDKLWLTVPDTKEGKIGTAIKSQIRVPEDSPYWLVGADFSTQELNIAALLSDWFTSHELGSNDFSYRVFAGSKEDKSDLHSALANQFGISRGVAKSLNFAGLYNCSAGRYATVLKQEGVPQADKLAKEILISKRGEKLAVFSPYWVYTHALLSVSYNPGFLAAVLRFSNKVPRSKPLSVGGTDSWYYNSIEARLTNPRTPLLDCRMPIWLERANSQGDEFMTAANWNIQSTGVDILCLFLVLMDWLKHHRQLNFSYVVSRHDEIWFLAHESEIQALAECMQLAHISCWASLAYKLGIHCLPESLCLFPEINVDKILRKEVDMEVWDGHGYRPKDGYYIRAKEFIA